MLTSQLELHDARGVLPDSRGWGFEVDSRRTQVLTLDGHRTLHQKDTLAGITIPVNGALDNVFMDSLVKVSLLPICCNSASK